MHVLPNNVYVAKQIQVNFLGFESFAGKKKVWEDVIEKPFLDRVYLRMSTTKVETEEREGGVSYGTERQKCAI